MVVVSKLHPAISTTDVAPTPSTQSLTSGNHNNAPMTNHANRFDLAVSGC
jgi:hypothetical protein